MSDHTSIGQLPSKRAKTFAIDYDGTWSADPPAFEAFASLLRRRGHRVIVITARAWAGGDVREACSPYVDRVLTTSGAGKQAVALASNESVDIWIDDTPGSI